MDSKGGRNFRAASKDPRIAKLGYYCKESSWEAGKAVPRKMAQCAESFHWLKGMDGWGGRIHHLDVQKSGVKVDLHF